MELQTRVAKRSWKKELQEGVANSSCKKELQKGVAERSCRKELQKGVAEKSFNKESQNDNYNDHTDSKTGNATKTSCLGSLARLVLAIVLRGFEF